LWCYTYNNKVILLFKRIYLLSAFQAPKPFGLALKSPNFGPVCIGGGERIDSGAEGADTGGGLNFGRIGEKLGPE
jgi:hypothetical protein